MEAAGLVLRGRLRSGIKKKFGGNPSLCMKPERQSENEQQSGNNGSRTHDEHPFRVSGLCRKLAQELRHQLNRMQRIRAECRRGSGVGNWCRGQR